VVSCIEIGGVADRTTKFDGFERVGVVEGNEIGDEIRALGLEPEMKEKKTSIEGTASIHEAAELNRVWIGTQIKSNVRKAIIDGDRHRRKDGSCGRKVSWKRFNVKEQESGFLQRGRKGRRKRGRGGGIGRVNGGNGISGGKGRPGGKGLGRRNARRQRGKIRRKQFVR
jgi:hypothetical protein